MAFVGFQRYTSCSYRYAVTVVKKGGFSGVSFKEMARNIKDFLYRNCVIPLEIPLNLVSLPNVYHFVYQLVEKDPNTHWDYLLINQSYPLNI